MGLDMYVHRRTYIGNNYKKPEEQVKIDVKDVKQDRVTEIVEVVGYWRKANAIHAWIVTNVQDEKDDCGDHYFSEEKIKELLNIVDKVLAASKLIKGKIQNGTRYENGKESPIIEDGKIIEDPTIAKELLPTQPGFFFGGTDYNEYYYQDLVDTKKILESLLKEDGDYYYHSSW